MKFIIAALLLILCHLTAFCHVDAMKMSSSLQAKLKEIDTYVTHINQRTDLKEESRTDILMDDTETTHTSYIDSVTKEMVKTLDEKHTGYYRDKQMVYQETRDWDKTNVTYFENGKVIFTTYHLDTEKIQTIFYNVQTGGKSGNYYVLKLTKDSVIFTAGVPRTKTRFVKRKTNSLKNWNKLISLFKLSDFDNVKSGERHVRADGEHTFIRIVTEYHTLDLLNGSEDTVHYEKIRAFAEKLNKMSGQ